MTLTSDLVLKNNCGRSISLYTIYILFDIRIPIWVCECILGWWSVLFHLRVTVTLTSDLVFRKSCPEHISFIIKGRNSKWCVDATLDGGVSHSIFGHFDLDL